MLNLNCLCNKLEKVCIDTLRYDYKYNTKRFLDSPLCKKTKLGIIKMATDFCCPRHGYKRVTLWIDNMSIVIEKRK